MKKINRVFNTISLSILLLAIIGLSGTFLSDYLVSIDWFNDDPKGGIGSWGARHYWYNWSVFFLLVTAIARAAANVVMIIDEK